jgi:hypothetical protein
MQQHNFDTLIQEEEQKFNKSKREEVVPRYESISPFYYLDDQKNEKFEQRA